MTDRIPSHAASVGAAPPAHPARIGRTVAAAGAALAIALAFGSVAFVALMPLQPNSPGAGGTFGATLGSLVFLALFVPLTTSLAVMGLLVTWRRPGHPIGPLMIATAICLGLSFGGGTYSGLSTVRPGPPLPGAALADWFSSWSSGLALGLIGIFVPLLFPDGTFLTSRWRRLTLILAGITIVSTLATALVPGPLGNDPTFVNPFGITGAEPLLDPIVTVLNLLAPVGFGSALLCLVLRYRRGTAEARQQIKLFAYPVVITVVALLLSLTDVAGLGDVAWEAALVAMTGIPVAIAIAIVRYRLFAIDRLISRTVAYALLTVLLVASYGLAVLLFQALLAAVSGEAGPLAVAAATLVVAALFQPLRRRLQAAVDRRFDRGHYDAERLVAAFGGQLRDSIELDEVRGALLEVTAQALHPVAATLWLRRPSDS